MNKQRSLLLAIAALVATAAMHAPSASANPTVFGLRYMATSNATTSVSWFKAIEATTYNVYVNGTLVRTVTDPELTATITLPQLLGPKDVVTAEVMGADGVKSEQVRAVYRYLFPPYDTFMLAAKIDFPRGSWELHSEDNAKIGEIVEMLKTHGFGELQVVGHNAVPVGTFNALTMAQARAEAVSDAIADDLVVPTTVLTHGVKVTNGFAADPATRQVEIWFR